MTTSKVATDGRYVNIVVAPIRKCAEYTPKFGQGGAGFTLDDFRAHYQADQFYSWFGLDNPLMYAAHKAAGGMTSVYRQIGIGCEQLFRQILVDTLGITIKDASWSYEVGKPGGGTRRLSLDARIPLPEVADESARKRVHEWIARQADALGVDDSITKNLTGVVFEVRQGYKSKDSKRQNADIGNAATAYTKTYLPCAVILSSQIDTDIAVRYRGAQWAMLTGDGLSDPMVGTYAFMRDVVGYDLAAFFERNRETLAEEVDKVLRKLLSPETP